MALFDTIIKGGTIVEGTGLPRFIGDIGIKDGHIAKIGKLDAQDADEVLNAEGLIVAPGFVDLHTHYDAQLHWDPYCTISGWHGVTSVAVGNCGFGFAPARPEMRERLFLMMTRTEQIPYDSMVEGIGLDWDWESLPEWMDHLERQPKGVNILNYVPLNPLMIYVMGLERAKSGEPATKEEQAEMMRLVDEAMDAGMMGIAAQRLGDKTVQADYDGTPMPTQSDIVAAGVITNEDLWALAHYVRSLSPEQQPEVREVVSAERITGGAVPETVNDEAWQDVESIYVPLVGQVVVKPRWFNPRVRGVWVQALHDGQEVALLVSWTDPSMSPDPTWTDFAQQIIETMAPGDEGAATAPGAPDQLVVQFPATLSDGMERPFFLQGDARRPTNTWTWRSDAPGAVESIARGLGTAVPQPDGEQHVTTVVQHTEGEWKVLFRRSLDTGGPEDLVLPVG
ncbi:MAG TPA: hypothetical protein EYQ81_09620, partial [Sneathiellales bacterium]|nr:hypothetical protein [Sneathiellales bacterium]